MRKPDGLTPFQCECERSTQEAITVLGYALCDRAVMSIPDNTYIRARIALTDIVVWFHDDTIGFKQQTKEMRFEHWDFSQPRTMIEAFLRELRTRLPHSPDAALG